ncbi:cell division protein FtsL [Streptococcus moroccensis]|uniref:Cell division protein FtsL n=1 Tax=Streptococcus moroccensis TaxID=1451356 RepID=A0ABT9YVP3_9STRE|nr:cell division protein FtsL [Streptococcus moroccensis]MDQ0223398.1 cell division protein FtsL [Streptococcus moroccensis]
MPKEDQNRQAFDQLIRERVKTFTRVEKAFYGSIVLTGIIVAVSIIYMQTNLLQVQSEMTTLKTQLDAKQLEYDEAKQANNELMRYNRLMEIAEEAGLTLNKESTGTPSD